MLLMGDESILLVWPGAPIPFFPHRQDNDNRAGPRAGGALVQLAFEVSPVRFDCSC